MKDIWFLPDSLLFTVIFAVSAVEKVFSIKEDLNTCTDDTEKRL